MPGGKRELWGNVRVLEVIADILEDGRDLWAKQNQRSNDHYGHERDDQRVLYQTLPALAGKHALEHQNSLPHPTQTHDDAAQKHFTAGCYPYHTAT